MEQPRKMSPMKAMMGMKRSPSARTLKRVSGAIKKASSSVMRIKAPIQSMKRTAIAAPVMRKAFGQATFGPKLRLDDGKMQMPNMKTAQSTPAMTGGVKTAATPLAPVAARTLKRASKVKAAAAPTK